MAKPEKPQPGCFSGFLRVVLCAGNGTSPPVHPSDYVTELDESEHVNHHRNKDDDDDDETVNHAGTPGVVARLMGLDSLPKTNFTMRGTTPNSVPRSRSVNFVDYLLDFDLNQSNHRRVKTSASFRETPSVVHKQNHDHLVVLYLDDNASKDHEDGCVISRKLESGLGEWKQRKKQGSKKTEVVFVREKVCVKKERNQGKNKKISKLKNEPRRVPSCKHGKKVRSHGEAEDLSTASSRNSVASSSSPLLNKQKKGFVEGKLTKNKGKPKKVDTDYSSENLSPVSVLDLNDYRFLDGIDFQDGTSPLASKPKCKSSLFHFKGDGVEERRERNNKVCSFTDLNREAEYFSELMLKLQTLTEKDIRESVCTLKNKYHNEGFEEICVAFEHKILDHLLHEFVSEVVELSS